MSSSENSKTWFDFVDGVEFVRKIFPTAPVLRGLRVFEVDFHRDGPQVMIRFDLNEFPANPPRKWIDSGVNRVQIRLLCIGIVGVEMRGWTANNIADMEISPSVSGGVSLVVQGEGFFLRGDFEYIAVEGLSAYCDAS